MDMFQRACFSRCLQALVYWCGFHVAGGESERCILLWCLAVQTIAARLSSCWRLLLYSVPRVRKSTELLWHKTPDFTPDMRPPNRSDLSPVDYRVWIVIQKCICQKQQGTSNIVNEPWLLIEWCITCHKARANTPIRRGGTILLQFRCKYTSISTGQKLSKYNAVW